MSTMLFIGVKPIAFIFFLIQPGESLTTTPLIDIAQYLEHAFLSSIVILNGKSAVLRRGFKSGNFNVL